MNRLTEFFKASKLAKMQLVTARERATRVKDESTKAALLTTVDALAHVLTAFNNVAAIGFGVKAKPRRRPAVKGLQAVPHA